VKGDVERTPTPEEMQRLTQGERRAIWISAALFLACLFAFFAAAAFLGNNVEDRNPFLPFVYYLTEVIAATAAGVLASTISGFFKIELERVLKHKGRLFVQATGGFAVFLIVMIASPRHQMGQLAELLFASQLQSCTQGLPDIRAHPDAEQQCLGLTEEYPLRPEPWRYLAQYTHRQATQTSQFALAAQQYEKALHLYRAKEREGYWLFPKQSVPPIAVEALRGFGAANADATLHAYGDRIRAGGPTDSPSDCQRNHALSEHERSELDRSESALKAVLSYTAEDEILNRTAAYDALGKIALYRYYLDGGKQAQLDEASGDFEKALEIPSEFRFFHRYHQLIAALESTPMPNASTEVTRAAEVVIFRDLLENYPTAISSPANAQFAQSVATMLRQMAANVRPEAFEITVPFGSRCFGGPAFSRFLHDETQLEVELAAAVGGELRASGVIATEH
jgi:hypothetical protein